MTCPCGYYSSCVGSSRGCSPFRIEYLKELAILERWLGVYGQAAEQEEDQKDRDEDREGEYR